MRDILAFYATSKSGVRRQQGTDALWEPTSEDLDPPLGGSLCSDWPHTGALYQVVHLLLGDCTVSDLTAHTEGPVKEHRASSVCGWRVDGAGHYWWDGQHVHHGLRRGLWKQAAIRGFNPAKPLPTMWSGTSTAKSYIESYHVHILCAKTKINSS